MEFIGPDDAADAVPIALFVVGGPADKEACDLRQHLRAVVDQIREIPGDLVELPRVVRDGDADVLCASAGVGIPPTAARIEVQQLAFLTPVAAGLPREHRTGVAGRRGGVPSLRQSSVSVSQQGTGDHRQPQIEHREDEQLVPEDVARDTPRRAVRAPAPRRQGRKRWVKPSAADAADAVAGCAIRL